MLRLISPSALVAIITLSVVVGAGCRRAADNAPLPKQSATASAAQTVRISRPARENLGVVSKPLKASTYWRTLEIPAVIVHRPGISSRGVVSPVTGVVTKILAQPGQTVDPDTPLFNIRLVSEALHASQLELFKATREIEIAEAQHERLSGLAAEGAVAKSRIIDIDNQILRLQATVEAYRQDLQTRGLSTERIAAAARGEFVTEVTVSAPGEKTLQAADAAIAPPVQSRPTQLPFSFEVQDLAVELGEQVQSGQVLCYLADHRSLLIEGRGFKDDMPLVQQAAKQGQEVELEFDAPAVGEWSEEPRSLRIDYVSNTINPETRTFTFFLPLENQWQAYQRDGKNRLLWRFRPGDRVRLHVPVEAMENVFVLPRAALVREGPEAYVFRQNGDLFDRKPVHVLHEDRRNVVLANDGSVRSGFYVAQSAAASLNRVLKAQASTGTPAGAHVHADGTVHEAH